MFKEGQVYKAKVEVSPEVMGFGRATIVAVESRSVFVQLKSSKGMKVSRGAKIWFVASSQNNRFNGLWLSEIKASKEIDGMTCLECSTPKFEQSTQKRVHARSDLTAPLEIEGDDWKDLAGKIMTRNVSRFGLGFAVQGECTDRFVLDSIVLVTYEVGAIKVRNNFRIVNARFNWLLNRTEVGAEITNMDAPSLENIERVLASLGNQSKGTQRQISESGSLSRWVRAGKENTSFVKPATEGNENQAAEANERETVEENEAADINEFDEDVGLD